MEKFVFYDDMLINVISEEQKPSGGAAVQTLAWMKGLAANGHEVVGMTDIPKTFTLRKDCKEFKIIPFFDKNKGIRILRWFSYRIPFIVKSIKSIKPDYFVQGIPDWSSFVFAVICPFLGIRYIVRASNDNLIDERVYLEHSKLKACLLNLGLALSFAIICQNEYQYSKLKRRFPKKKIIKFGNPFFNPPLKNIENYSDRNYIAWVGLFQYQKNLKLLFEIASYLKSESFKIAGVKNFVDTDKETELYTTKLRELQNVEFTGFLSRPELMIFLGKAKFLLNTSHYEGFSNTFLESMICGTPILTTKNVNPDNIIEEKAIGFLYNDVMSIEYYLTKLSESDFDMMKNNCINYVKLNHDPNILADKLMSFLNES